MSYPTNVIARMIANHKANVSIATIRALMQKGASVNEEFEHLCSLQWAVFYGNASLVEDLLCVGAVCSADCCDVWSSPLQIACSFGYVEVVQILLKRESIIDNLTVALQDAIGREQTLFDDSPHAPPPSAEIRCTVCHRTVISLLIDAGASVHGNTSGDCGPTLHIAAASPFHVFDLLVRGIVDVDEENSIHESITALEFAAGFGRIHSVLILIALGAGRESFRAAFVAAVRNRHLNVAQILASAGGDVFFSSKIRRYSIETHEIIEDEGKTSLQIAIDNDDREMESLIVEFMNMSTEERERRRENIARMPQIRCYAWPRMRSVITEVCIAWRDLPCLVLQHIADSVCFPISLCVTLYDKITLINTIKHFKSQVQAD